jgi:hypothetical protein
MHELSGVLKSLHPAGELLKKWLHSVNNTENILLLALKGR